MNGPTTTTGWRTLFSRSEEGDVAPSARKATTPSTNSWTVDGSWRDCGGSTIFLLFEGAFLFESAFVVNSTNPMVPCERAFVAVAHTHTPRRTARPPTAPPRRERDEEMGQQRRSQTRMGGFSCAPRCPAFLTFRDSPALLRQESDGYPVRPVASTPTPTARSTLLVPPSNSPDPDKPPDVGPLPRTPPPLLSLAHTPAQFFFGLARTGITQVRHWSRLSDSREKEFSTQPLTTLGTGKELFFSHVLMQPAGRFPSPSSRRRRRR